MTSLSRLLSFPVFFGLLLASTTLPANAQTGMGDSQSFGSVALGQSTTQTVTVVSYNPATQLFTNFGTDFRASATSCVQVGTGTFPTYNCSATVTFTPTAPGQRLDSIYYPNSDGVPTFQRFLYGTGAAPQIGFTFGAFATAAPSVANPGGITVGPDGLVYLSSTSAKDVFVSNPDGTNQQSVGFSGLGSPGAVVVDGETNVYVADTVNNKVYEKSQFAPPFAVPTTALSNPIALAVDGTGALYIADAGNNRIIKIDNSGEESTVAGELANLVGIGFDAAGDLFYAQGGTINSVHFFAGGDPNSPEAVGSSNYGTIQGMAVDAGGGVALATTAGVVVFSSFQNLLGTGFNGPTSVALDPQGNIYEAFKSATTNPVAIVTRNNGTLTEGIPPGQTTSATVYIANTGTSALTFTGFTLSDPAFSVNTGSTCNAGTSVQPGGTCPLTINFSPTTPKIYTATLTVSSNSLNNSASTAQYTLTGDTPQSNISVSVSPASSPVGQPVTFTAAVSASYYNGANFTTVTPTGTVDFVSGQTTLGSATLTTNPSTGGQQAIFTTSSLAPGTYNVNATYEGSGTIAGSTTSSPATVTVTSPSTPAATTTALSVSSANITFGSSETLTATIAGAASPAVTGTVTFFDGTAMLGTGSVTSTSTGGTASLTNTTLTVGPHQITAVYSGDTNYATSTSGAQTVTVAPAPTTTTLTLPATVAYRTPITLSAQVEDSNDTLLTVGQVIFCNASAPVCNPVLNLGIAQLTASGNAVLIIPSATPGDHSYKAVFLGRTGYASSTSGTPAVSVTGIYPSTSTITSTGSVGNYTLTGTVVGVGDRVVGPTGTVSFTDTTNANTVLGTAVLGAATLGFTTVQPTGSPITVGTHPYGIASGDFNGDGFADVVTGNYSAASVSVLLGNGDGTFQAAVTYAVGGSPERVLVADFNGDGKADIVVANTGSGTVSVLLGNGDGTFQTQVTYATGSPVGLGVMDLNHDGFPDIVAGNYYAGNVSVLINKGDGTFRAAVNYATGSIPQTLAEGDFNGDGNVDLAVGNLGNNTVGIFLGNGDGTFQTQITYAVGRAPQGVQVGDFNGDGKQDLAVSNSTDNTISVLLGNGDGTFQTQVTYPVGIDPVGLVIADFNGDGIQDLSTGNTGTATVTDLTQSILLGNGDGTFQPQLKFPTGNFPYGEVAADFNGDGYPDLAIAEFNDSKALILQSAVTQTASATITGVAVNGPSGTDNVEVSYPGDTNFSASTSTTIPLMDGSAPTVASTTSLVIAPAMAKAGQSVLFSVVVAGSTQTTPIPTGTVTLTNTSASPAATIGTITLDATGSGYFNTSALPIGSYSITATYSGDGNYAASTSPSQSLSVTNSTVSAGASSTVPSGGVAPGSPIDYTFFGNTSVEFNQPGGGQPTVLTNFTVNTLTNVEYPGNGNYTRLTAPGGLSAFTTGSLTENPTNYPNTTPHTTLLATFSPLKAGSFSVNILDGNTDGVYVGNSTVGLGVNGGAQVATTSHYLSGTNEFTTYTILNASPADVFQVYATTTTNSYPTIGGLTFTVGVPMSTSTSLTASAANIAPGEAETLTATVSGIASPAETGTILFSDQSGALGSVPVTATATGGTAALTLTTLSLGTHQITAAYSGDPNNIPSVSIPRTVVVALTPQTITFPAIPSHIVTDAPFALSATASSGLAVTYNVVSGPATISGSTVTLTGNTGTVAIQASQAGNTTYAAAPGVTQTFTVSAAPVATLTSITPATIVTGSAATTITLTGTSFLASDIVQLNGVALTSTVFVSATTLTAVIPAGTLKTAGTLQITVNDPVGRITTNALTLTVSSTPAVVFTGPTTVPTSATQPALTFQLTNPFPVTLNGTIALTFAPTPTANGANDPAVQFSSGGRTIDFTIPANSTATPAVQLQTGTIAGTITVALTLLDPTGANLTPASVVPVVIVIPPAAPTLTLVALNPSGKTLNVVLAGYSNTREATKATFHFTAAPGATVDTPDITADVTALFSQWYSSAASTAYGSTVIYTQTFNLDNDASTIGGVTVTLTNSVGTSNTGTAQ